MALRAISMPRSNAGSWGTSFRPPSASSVTNRKSPCLSCSRASSSLGRMTPVELPIFLTSIFMADLHYTVCITYVIQKVQRAERGLSFGGRLSVHGLELVDQALDHLEPHRPEVRVGGIEAERREQFLVVLGAARREHVEIALGKALIGFLVDGIERVHETIAEGIGVDVERRMDEMRDVTPKVLVALLQLDGGS